LEGLTVVERVFEGFVSQAIPLLEKINPQPPLQPDGRASAFAFGIEWFDDGQRFRPWNEGCYPREKLLAVVFVWGAYASGVCFSASRRKFVP
jgi:hypothetical protein